MDQNYLYEKIISKKRVYLKKKIVLMLILLSDILVFYNVSVIFTNMEKINISDKYMYLFAIISSIFMFILTISIIDNMQYIEY